MNLSSTTNSRHYDGDVRVIQLLPEHAMPDVFLATIHSRKIAGADPREGK